MRSAFLLAILLSLLAPAVAAGPLADSGLATHEQQCESYWEASSDPDAGTFHSIWAAECRERHYIGAGDEGTLRVEVGEGETQGTRGRAHHEYWSENDTSYYTWVDEYRFRDVDATYATASAGGAEVAAESACGHDQTQWYSGELLGVGDTHSWGTHDMSSSRAGCWEEARASVGDKTVASAWTMDGCEGTWSNDGVFYQHYGDGDIAYERHGNHTTDSRCGRGAGVGVAEEVLWAGRGERCTGEGSSSSYSHGDDWWYSASTDSECVRGIHAVAPAGTKASVGDQNVHREACSSDDGCSSSNAPGPKGIFLDVAGERIFLSLEPEHPALLP